VFQTIFFLPSLFPLHAAPLYLNPESDGWDRPPLFLSGKLDVTTIADTYFDGLGGSLESTETGYD
jgi:hypothetical protein